MRFASLFKSAAIISLIVLQVEMAKSPATLFFLSFMVEYWSCVECGVVLEGLLLSIDFVFISV
jgi:hypothetical protein